MDRIISFQDIFGVCLRCLRTKSLIDDANNGMASSLVLFGITDNLYGSTDKFNRKISVGRSFGAF